MRESTDKRERNETNDQKNATITAEQERGVSKHEKAYTTHWKARQTTVYHNSMSAQHLTSRAPPRIAA